MTISARDGLTIFDRAARDFDHAAAERIEEAQKARADQERMMFLYSRLFRNITPARDVAALRTEDEAREMFSKALANADNLLQVEILREAVDNRWASVVTAFIKVWNDEHPISKTVEELWNLKTGRASA